MVDDFHGNMKHPILADQETSVVRTFSPTLYSMSSHLKSQLDSDKKETPDHYTCLDGTLLAGNICGVRPDIKAKLSTENLDSAGDRNVIGVGSSWTSTSSDENGASGSCQCPTTITRSGNSSQCAYFGTDMIIKAAGDHGPNMLQTLLPENSDDCKEPTEDDKLNVRLQDSGTCGIKVIKKLEGSIIVNRNQTMGKEISPLDFDASDKGSVEAGHESQHVAENIASKKTEVLWNGSLQLTSSIFVSTIAYFKSGEKVPENNWSNNIEVKGKVKLEAFEKFIKEFRCSRNRSLMVISLCWKAGSSRSGLAGMKEVAKVYKEKKRIGFAQLCPAIDLYVCPRSETIITILAKYGFFKGMAAIEEDQDSFIGCVVWKKNRSSSSSKNPKRTNNVLPKQQFPNDSATLQIAESSKCTIQETTSPSDGKDIKSSGDSSIIHSSSDNIVTIPPPKRENLSVLTSGMSTTCKPEVISSADPELRPSTVEHQALNHVELQKSVSGFESQPIVPFQAPHALPEPYVKSDSPDEDDLPEFDFSTACGLPPQQFQDVPPSDTHGQTLVQKSGPKFPLLPMPAVTMILNQNRQQISTSTRIISKSHQNNAISNSRERESQATMFVPEGNNSTHPIVPVSRANDSAQDNRKKIRQKSMWNSVNNDDDDMPEWHPDFERKDLKPFSTTICPSVPPFIHKRRPEQVLFLPPLPAHSPHVRPSLPPFKQVLPHELQPGNLFQCPMNDRPEVPPQAQQIAKFMKLDSRPPGVSPNVWGRVQLRLFGALPPVPYSNFQNPRH